jgi:hypothetical protein
MHSGGEPGGPTGDRSIRLVTAQCIARLCKFKGDIGPHTVVRFFFYLLMGYMNIKDNYRKKLCIPIG